VSNFTPGPWEIVRNEEFDKVLNIHTKQGSPIVNVAAGFSWRNADEGSANANLISAAPDMYEALMMVVSYLGDSQTWEEGESILFHHVSKALTKADGGNSNV
jgi:hypothetical protein